MEVFGTTMDQSSGRSFALQAHAPFTQLFRARATGVPTELGVRMGANQNPYGVRLELAVNGAKVLDRTFTGCRQRTSDWATVFSFPDVTAPIRAGDRIAFTITTDMEIGIEPLFLGDPDYPRGTLKGYGDVTARFYLSGTSTVQPAPAPPAPVPVPGPAPSPMSSVPAGYALNIGPKAPPKPGMRPMSDDDGYPIGRPIAMQAPNTATYAVTDAAWTFSNGGGLVQTCVQTLAAGSSVAVPSTAVHQNPWVIYGRVPGTYSASVAITATTNRGRTERWMMQASAKVTAPAVGATTRGETKSVGIRGEGSTKRLMFGDYFNSVPGFAIRVAATLPPGESGAIAALQVLKGSRKHTRLDGSVVDITTGGQWFLDTKIPYADRTAAGAASAAVVFQTNDSPTTKLQPACKKTEVNETLRTYVVYKSDFAGAYWFPIGYFEATWTATAERADANSAWALSASSATPTASYTFTPSNELPTWAGNVTALQAQADAAFGRDVQLAPPSWIDTPATNRQMRISLDTAPTGDMRDAIVAATGAPLGPYVTPIGYLTWTSPSAANAARSVAHVTNVAEISADERVARPKTPDADRKLAAATLFTVSVAPYCYGLAADPALLAQSASDLSTVGAALVAAAAGQGLSATFSTIGSTAIKLTFTSAPGRPRLVAIAGHPQVSFVDVSPDFHFSDPTSGSHTI
jgi:hypothetical protein